MGADPADPAADMATAREHIDLTLLEKALTLDAAALGLGADERQGCEDREHPAAQQLRSSHT